MDLSSLTIASEEKNNKVMRIYEANYTSYPLSIPSLSVITTVDGCVLTLILVSSLVVDSATENVSTHSSNLTSLIMATLVQDLASHALNDSVVDLRL